MFGVEVRRWTFHVEGFEIVMESVETKDDFIALRKQVNAEINGIMLKAAESHVVPRVNQTARFVRTVTGMGVVARASGRQRVYITTMAGTRAAPGTRKLARIAGMLEWGGTVRPPILAVRKGKRYKDLSTSTFDLEPKDYYRKKRRRAAGHSIETQIAYTKDDRRSSFTNSNHAGAVSAPGGARFIVTKPRHYEGKHLILRGVKASLPAYSEEVKTQILSRASGQGWEVQQ